MKTGIHPQLHDTKVHCNGCDTSFVVSSTVPTITVEICSQCHPFYTGKQKLLDTAGRVDKFKARQAAATKHASATAKAQNSKDAKLVEIQNELESETVAAESTEATETNEATTEA